MLYNVYTFLLYSKMNQSYIQIYALLSRLPHSGHHGALNRVPCALQYVTISHLLYVPSHFSRVQLCATPCIVSMGCSRQEHWSGLPRPLPGDLPDPGIELTSPEASALADGLFCFLFFFFFVLPLSYLGSPIYCIHSINSEYV